ncbi:hypothetical protein H5410_023589 [Solanum commersonii]|uniref:Uncharacterized protein n=1 Tax=Solanum commersonii TaxID=4109 RepID=A0A9J5ZJR8_SOLCO|nr:hypothetical protein H5410_023589 [Solanum commersonii]
MMFAGYIASALCTGYIRFDTFHIAGYIALCTGYIRFDTFHIAGYIALCTGYIAFDTFLAGYIALYLDTCGIHSDAARDTNLTYEASTNRPCRSQLQLPGIDQIVTSTELPSSIRDELVTELTNGTSTDKLCRSQSHLPSNSDKVSRSRSQPPPTTIERELIRLQRVQSCLVAFKTRNVVRVTELTNGTSTNRLCRSQNHLPANTDKLCRSQSQPPPTTIET